MEELSLSGTSLLKPQQVQFLLRRTPKKYIKERPAKGGGKWKYVSGKYVRKCLNLLFGWDWDFDILSETIAHGEVVVKGRLTVRVNGQAIVKTQMGNKEIIYKRVPVLDDNGIPAKDERGKVKMEPGPEPLSIGNDMKAAATDALKKCASELGIAADVYSDDDEFTEVVVYEANTDTILEQIQTLYLDVDELLAEDDRIHLDRIIKEKEEMSYPKAIKLLTKIKGDAAKQLH